MAKIKVRFKTVIWLLAIAAGLWMVGGPLLQNTWAKIMWHQIPCSLAPSGRFFYYVDGNKYVSSRTNFWTSGSYTEPIAPDAISVDGQTDATCWISARDPLKTVLRLDPWQQHGEATGRFAAAALLLAAAAVITFLGDRKRPKYPANAAKP